MDIDYHADRFAANAETIQSLVRGAGGEAYRWKENQDQWSIHDIVCHLYDEEREDFRKRIDYTLHKPGEPWPPIDPQGWVKARDYESKDTEQMLLSFLEERKESIRWLRSMEHHDWNLSYDHPLGKFTAGSILASWLAHDYLHIRQITHRLFVRSAKLDEPHSTSYAGAW